MNATISVKRAAELMGTTEPSIRWIIAHNMMPIGYMLPQKKGSVRRTFKVFAYKVAEITGIPIEKVIGEGEEADDHIKEKV